MEKWSDEWKRDQLNQLRTEWAGCKRCKLCETRKNVVFGEGNVSADILFIGEAPGKEEDISGTPFCGDSGNLFHGLLLATKIKLESVFITNILGCQPPENRHPQREERDACLARVFNIIYLIDPLLIVPMGAIALKALAKGRDWAITEQQGELFSSPHPSFKIAGDQNGLEIPGLIFPKNDEAKRKHCLEYDMLPIVHPAFILKEDSFDSQTKKFESKGWAESTVLILNRIRQLIEQIHTEHENVRRHA